MNMKKNTKKNYDDTNILLNNKRVEHRQIHCILNHFDNGYKKLTNLKDKKNCLKNMVEQTNCVSKTII